MRIGWLEVALILAIILIIFGPGKLTGLIRSHGQTIENFKQARRGNAEEDKSTKSIDGINKHV